MIVKVQINLQTTEEEPQVLVYDQSHRIFDVLPLEKCPGLEEVMADAGPLKRAYFKAHVTQGKVHLDARVQDQEW